MGRRRVLDTNRLICFWRRQRTRPIEDYTEEDAKGWATRLADPEGTTAILTPVRIEFLCGVTTAHELNLSRAHLSTFVVVDQGRINADDWANAERYASRIPRDGSRHDFGDCLIEAIARRLGCEIITSDDNLGRRSRSNDPGFQQ